MTRFRRKRAWCCRGKEKSEGRNPIPLRQKHYGGLEAEGKGAENATAGNLDFGRVRSRWVELARHRSSSVVVPVDLSRAISTDCVHGVDPSRPLLPTDRGAGIEASEKLLA